MGLFLSSLSEVTTLPTDAGRAPSADLTQIGVSEGSMVEGGLDWVLGVSPPEVEGKSKSRERLIDGVLGGEPAIWAGWLRGEAVGVLVVGTLVPIAGVAPASRSVPASVRAAVAAATAAAALGRAEGRLGLLGVAVESPTWGVFLLDGLTLLGAGRREPLAGRRRDEPERREDEALRLPRTLDLGGGAARGAPFSVGLLVSGPSSSLAPCWLVGSVTTGITGGTVVVRLRFEGRF